MTVRQVVDLFATVLIFGGLFCIFKMFEISRFPESQLYVDLAIAAFLLALLIVTIGHERN